MSVPTTSFLQMNTTDDSFPILVRKDNIIGPAGLSADYPADHRKTSLTTASSSFGTSGLHRHSLGSVQPRRGMLDDLEIAQNRPLPDISLPPGQKTSATHGFASGSSHLTGGKGIPNLASTGSRSPLGTLAPMSNAIHPNPIHSPGLYNPYGIIPPGYPTHHGLSSFPVYNMSHVHHMNTNELHRMHNPYATARNATYNKRAAEDVNRYADVALETLVGDIYSLCKDQHGCRYLQKKLDERNPASVDIIFAETYLHAAELMIDPFGNYLCQKLLEHSDDQKRLQIVQHVAPDLVNISLNMHGTRAIQKMIEYLTTSEQIKIATQAFSTKAVTLIKDLNGNHVIQKCLNRLGSNENQFIYDAVSHSCVEVATHRHGCCVLQRCIDHASEDQKSQIIKEITANAAMLVQDPFGNYVVQYVLDLGDARFSDALIRQFIGSVCLFSVQKFSSNVIEKCLRVAEPKTRAKLIEELLHKSRLEKLLRDSFANYVIQTALDYADSAQRVQLVDCIRPLLPAIRSTPYGRRIQSKISGSLPGTFNGNFMVPQTMLPFPAHSLDGPSRLQAIPSFATHQKSFKGDYEY